MTTAPFISWIGHGAASLAPPGVFTGVQGHAFGIRADRGAMQRLTDKLLNAAAGGEVHYEAVAPMALLSFLDVARCTSGTDAIGWLPGRECAIWVPLIERNPHHILPWRPVFWAPYIFINYTIGMLTGREVWGWPKVHADIGVMRDNPAAPAFSCDTTFFRELDATQRGEHGTLYRIVPNGPADAAHTPFQHGQDAAHTLIDRIFGGAAEAAAELAERFGLHPTIPSVVLKQFRDAANPELACFQAIVDSPVQITQFSGGGLLAQPFQLEITTCASHQIVRDFLGQDPVGDSTTLPVEWAAWVEMDMQALAGRDIVPPS